MANLTSSSIANGSTIEASHITALYDVFTGAATYDNISIAGNVASASYALTASYAENGGGGGTVDTGSLLITASISNDRITFTKGDASEFDLTVNNVVNADTASFVTTAQTASYITASSVDGIVSIASQVGPIFKDPNGGVAITQKGSILAVGSVLLSSGIGSGSATPVLANLTNGTDCYVMLTAASGMNPGEGFEASITTSSGQGRVAISDPAGNSNAVVSYVVFS
jgi:hypothetical protein